MGILTSDETCKRDENRLAQLRLSPSGEEAQRFLSELGCEKLRPHLGALLLGYYTDDGKLIYAGRVGTGMPVKVLADIRRRLSRLPAKPRL